MGDDDFSDLELDDGGDQENVRSPVNDVPNSFKDAFLSFTQRTQRPGGNYTEYGECVDPNNDFEQILADFGVSVRRDNYEKLCLYLEGTGFAQLKYKLNKGLSNAQQRDKMIVAFESAIETKESLRLYLSPSASSQGSQETLFRALLTCPHTQVRTFDILLRQTDSLARHTDEDSKSLSIACVAQVRFLERVVDSGALFQSIFDRDIEEWNPSTRDYLIETLPEVLTDPVTQQDAALALMDMISRKPSKDSLSFRSAIVSTLRLLRMSGSIAKTIRIDLSRSAMNLEAPVIPDMVAFCIHTLSFDNKSTLNDVLELLSVNIKVEALRVERTSKRVTVDDVVINMFSKICRYVQLEGTKGWKEVNAFLRSLDRMTLTHSFRRSNATESEEDVRENEGSSRVFGLFEVLLTLSLISSEGCPSSILTTFKNQITAYSEAGSDFSELCKTALQYRKFCSRNLSSLTSLSQQCLWSPQSEVRCLGALLYEQFFITIESSRADILNSMLAHLPTSEGEAAAILGTLESLVNSHFDAFLPFVEELKNCLDHVDIMSLGNIKRLFGVLISIYSSDSTQQEVKLAVEQCITKFMSSISEKERIWGLLGMLMQLQNYLTNKNVSNREIKIVDILKQMEEKSKSTRMRSVMYVELASILQMNIHSIKSTAILNWMEGMFVAFRRDFFINRPKDYHSDHDLEDEKYVDSSCELWLNTSSSRLIELVPLFQLLKEAALLRQRWETDDDTQTAVTHHFAQLYFAFGANIVMDCTCNDVAGSPGDLAKSADVIYIVIDWIREILNAFSGCSKMEGIETTEVRAAWVRKFRLMFECQEKLHFHIKELRQWPLPIIPSHVDKIIIVAENTPAKRGRKGGRTAGGKRKKKNAEDGEEETEEPQELSAFSPEAREKATAFLEKSEKVMLAALLDRLRPLMLATVVRSLQLISDRRRATTFILQELRKVLKDVLPKRTAKSVPWEVPSATSKKVDPTFHGNSSLIWKLVTKVVSTILLVMNNVIEYFREDLNTSNVVERPPALVAQMAFLLRECLLVFQTVFSCEELSQPVQASDRVRENRQKKRRMVMEKMEHVIIQLTESQGDNAEDAELTVTKYLVSVAEVVPTADVAVALVQTLDCCHAWNDDLRDTMARHTLAFLKKEWLDPDGNTLKGAQLNSPVKVLVEYYIKFRSETHQLSAILWLLANKITELVPDEERRKSKTAVYEDVEDPGLTETDKRANFACFSRGTFGAIYKVMFSSLCSITQKRLASRDFLRSGLITIIECLKQWKVASNIFCLLCLMLRVKDLRNAGVLATAVREGKRFLLLFAKNSSFMYILEDSVRFTSVSDEASAIIKSVQVGNRSLQNISVYAKSAKSVVLLKSLPDLRATNELWMRAVHSAMVNIDCQDAFEIGHLKSRDIDGEVIRDEEEEASSSERDTPAPAGEDDAESDGGSRRSVC